MKPYNKPWLSHSDQVSLLKARGLLIPDLDKAAKFLSHLNYYRFSGYCLAFESSRHCFDPDTTFDQIKYSYEFDLSLRDLLNEALEIIEVDLRSKIAYEFGKIHGAFGHIFPHAFASKARNHDHGKWLTQLHEEADRSKEKFIVHFKREYQEFPNLPIWVATEIVTFGCLSRMFSMMEKKEQNLVAHIYALQSVNLASWLHHFNYVRNLCAHHARLWDRLWSIKPYLPNGKEWQSRELSGNDRVCCTLLTLFRMMRKCLPDDPIPFEWKQRVEKLLSKPPQSKNALADMGLIPHISQNSLWCQQR